MGQPTVFLNRTYDEALALVVEARNYIAHHEMSEQYQLPTRVRLNASYQAMRLTARLTQAMAWLLAQKAVQNGELSVADLASDDYALGGADVCADPSGADDETLPVGLRNLLERSHSLYARVERLDAQVRQTMKNKKRNGLLPPS